MIARQHWDGGHSALLESGNYIYRHQQSRQPLRPVALLHGQFQDFDTVIVKSPRRPMFEEGLLSPM
jgi:hypothetical protein